MRRFVSAEQAAILIPNGDEIHTFYQMGNALVGADWDRESILQKFHECDRIEIAGDSARSMGHGLAVYKSSTKWQSEVLFVQTDEQRLNEFDPLEYVNN